MIELMISSSIVISVEIIEWCKNRIMYSLYTLRIKIIKLFPESGSMFCGEGIEIWGSKYFIVSIVRSNFLLPYEIAHGYLFTLNNQTCSRDESTRASFFLSVFSFSFDVFVWVAETHKSLVIGYGHRVLIAFLITSTSAESPPRTNNRLCPKKRLHRKNSIFQYNANFII